MRQHTARLSAFQFSSRRRITEQTGMFLAHIGVNELAVASRASKRFGSTAGGAPPRVFLKDAPNFRDGFRI
jgi:hypothetical protein